MDCDLDTAPASAGAAWTALTKRSLTPSGHNSPELLIPALSALEGGHLATVKDSDGLRLAIPLSPRRFPLPYLTNWSSPVNFHGLPHLDQDFAVPALTAMLRKADQPILLQSIPIGGNLWEAMASAAEHMAVIDNWERAVLKPQSTYADWLDTNFERKRRKEYRRLQTRLTEQGKFQSLTLWPKFRPDQWVDEFLELEAAGWKGQRGTAMNADSSAVTALHEACRGLAKVGKLRFWKLALDGKPIAMLFAIVDGQEAWLGKIAHDENWARYSPGALLILHATEQCFAEGLTQVDSCAIPDHPMINHLWKDRLAVADVMVAAATVGNIKFNATVDTECLRRKVHAVARTAYHKLRGRHRS